MAIAPMHAKMKALMTHPLYSYGLKRPTFALEIADAFAVSFQIYAVFIRLSG
jgi:hypothetical protein